MNYQVMPNLSADDFEALKNDIAERGVLIPVEYDEDGNILDGHHRVRACEELGLVDWPKFIRKGLSEDEKRTHARQLNIARRHLNQAQKRDLIAEQLKETPSISSRAIAARLGVDHKTVGGVREELESIGEIPQCDRETSDGRTYPAQRKSIRTAFVDDTPEGEKEALARAKEVRTEKAKERKKERVNRAVELAENQFALSGKKTYRVIYADPPWRYNDKRDDAALDAYSGSDHHYPSMTISDLCALPVPDLAQDDAVLFLWVTSPLLFDAKPIIDAWGFTYKAAFVWDKVAHNVGHYNSVRHELLLICTRGSCTPDVPKLFDSVVSVERGKHSEKPEQFRELIDSMYPNGTRIELFRRGAAPENWDVWGNQSEVSDAA